MPRIPKDEALARVALEWEALPAQYQGCVMCALADGYPPGLEILSENEQALALLDRFGSRRGHVLVVLRRHVESIAELGWHEYSSVQRLVWEAAQSVEEAFRPMRTFVAALGSTAKLPNTFAHHHVHVIPLEEGSEDRPSRVFSWEPGVYVYSEEEGKEVADRLRGCWLGGVNMAK